MNEPNEADTCASDITALNNKTVSASVLMNGAVIPSLRVLLADVFAAIDASIPNKDQNRAVKRIITASFDAAYFDVLRRAYPDCNFGHSGAPAITPEPNRDKAFADARIK
jgi:hypothetical protein